MLTYIVIAPIVIAVLLYLLPFERTARAIAIAAQAALTAYAYWIFSLSKEGDIITIVGGHYSVLGIALVADSMSAFFVLLTGFFFLVAVIYSYAENHSRLFWFLMFIWQGSLLGIFLSGDMFNIFVLVEVATVIVAVLIMYNQQNRSLYDGMIYFTVNIVVMQFYLLGIGYLYRLVGTMDINRAAELVGGYDRHYLILPYALIMTFVALKCALLPLYSWLPKAHGSPAAPPAVSAILSGLHIKCAVYLFLRFQTIFHPIDASQFFLAVGIITGIVGFIFAMSQTDIKLILAYHTISQVGLIFTGLNIPDVYAELGGLYHTINHALFKGGLFLSAGVIVKAYHTRDVYKIRGLMRTYPVIGAATLMAIFGITGAPFFNGSISKYFMATGAESLLNGVLIFMSLGTIISFVKYSTMLFGKRESGEEVVKISALKQISILIMGVLCFVTGIFGVQSIEFLFGVTVSIDIMGYLEKIIIFFVSLGAGYLIYKYYVKKSALLKRLKHFELGFRGICAAMGVFFAVILIFVGFFTR
ncbi:MAG: hypothetical protein FWC64_01405 [Treponema sp.]|nr:hypothetical protein [Treponema sp.]